MMARRFPRTLRQTLVLLFCLSLAPLATVIVISFIAARSESYDAAKERIRILTEVARLSEQQLVADVRQTLFVLAHAPAVTHGDESACANTVRDVMRASIIYANLGVTDADGNVICNGLPLLGPVNLSDRAYFERAAAALDFGVGNYQVGRITGKRSVNFAFPVLSSRKTQVQRMVYAALDLAWLGTRLRAANLPETSRAWVFDANGDILAATPDESWVGRSVRGTALGAALAAVGAQSVVVEIDDLDGVRRLYGIAPVWASGETAYLHVAVGMPVSDVFVGVNRAFLLNIGLLLAGTAMLVLLTLTMLQRKVMRPIDTLVGVARRLAANDRSVRAPDESGIGEFAALGSAFNDMAQAIAERETDLAAHIAKVEQMGRRFRVLSAINQTIVHAEDERALFRTACASISAHGAGLLVWIGRLEDDGGETVLACAGAVATQDPWQALGEAGGEVRLRRLREGTRVIARLDDVETVGSVVAAAGGLFGASQYVGYPIERGDGIYGAVNILAGDDALWLDEAGLALISEIDGDIGFALANFDKDHEIRHLAFHDSLTGLANRAELVRQVDRQIQEASRTGAMVPLIKVELLSLQQRIKRFGHSAGDFVLRSFACELEKAAPSGSLVARTAELAFAVMPPPGCDPHDLPSRIEAMFAQLPRELQFGSQEITLEFNAGVSSYPDDGETALALLQASTLALDSLAPGRTGAVAYHSTRLSVEAQERWQIERHLGRAIAHGELYVHYQPTRDLQNGGLLGVEALLRWTNPELGVVSPGRFIPIAEQAGQIIEIGYWVFEETCRQMQAWIDAGRAPAYASVNVSVLQLYDPDFMRRIAALFDDFPAARERIAVEITETAMMDDFELSKRVLGELKGLGITIFVDDFGTGYSSLSYLRRLPVDTLKIDLVFTSELATSDEALSVIKAILALGHSLGLSTLAEGIETAEQEQILADIGCDVGQGYRIGRPLPPGDIATLFLDAAAEP